MNATPTIHNTKIAQLIVNGQPIDRGTFPAMKSLERNYKGYRTHVGYAPYFNGMHYCKGCAELVVKPTYLLIRDTNTTDAPNVKLLIT